MLAGDNVKRMMENRLKSNPQLPEEYSSVINVTLAPGSRREARRIVGHFADFLEGERPAPPLAALYLSGFSEHSRNTRDRYTHALSAFLLWSSDERLRPGRPRRQHPRRPATDGPRGFEDARNITGPRCCTLTVA